MEILTPPSVVWAVIADVEHWPEWTPSASRVKRLSPEPLQVGGVNGLRTAVLMGFDAKGKVRHVLVYYFDATQGLSHR